MTDLNYTGAAQGAIGGAAAGSAFGPWGAAIGGGVGLLGGLFGGGGQEQNQKYKDQLAKLATQYGNRQAPQTGPANLAQASDFRNNQAGLIAQLQAMAAGQGPSAAAIQMREAMDRAAAAQTSAAAGAGGRGVNQGAAYLNAANNSAAITAQGARDTAVLRAQEQNNAIGQLGQVVGQARGADEGLSQFNANAQNQGNIANLQAQLQQLGLNDESQLRALLGAVGVNAGPGLGAQILAGGASALPAILQMNSQQRAPQAPPVSDGGPITHPWQVP